MAVTLLRHTHYLSIRPVASAAVSAGDTAVVGGVGGFWLNDTAQSEEGEFVIAANLVQIDSDGAAHTAGQVFSVNGNGTLDFSPGASQDRLSPGITGVVYRDSGAADPVLAVWSQL